MRKIIITITAITLMFSFVIAGMIDKVYIFAENTQNNKNENKLLLKASIEKTKEYGKNSFSVFNIATEINYDLENQSDERKIDIRKFYYDITGYGGIINLRIGRGIKSFDYGNIFSITNYLSSSGSVGDPSDRTLKVKPMDGLSLSLIDPDDSKDVDSTATIHIYTKDITNEDKQKEQSHVIELTQVGDKFNQSIFIANETNADPSIAIARTKTIGDALNFTSALKYEHNENDFTQRLSSLLNFEYNLNSDSFIGIEYIHLAGKLKNEQEREDKHASFRSVQDFKDFYQDLNSKYYVSLYTKIGFDDFTTNLSTLENLIDGSRRINLQATYNMNSISLNSSITAHNDSKASNISEFGYLKNKAFEYEYRFFVSYLWLD